MNKLKKLAKTGFLCGAIVFYCVPVRASDTDARIETSFKDSHVYKTSLKDDIIGISVQDGVVTLKGVVKEKSHKVMAENAVEGLPGVQRVDNQLEVESSKKNVP